MPRPLLVQAVCSCGSEDCGMPVPVALGVVHENKIRERFRPEVIHAARQHGITIRAVPVLMPEDASVADALAWFEAFSSSN